MRHDPTVAQNGDGSWAFFWSAGTGSYQLWLDGNLIASPTTNSYRFTMPGFDTVPPELEILDAGDVAENLIYPPFALLQWRGHQSANGYVIEIFTGDSSNPWQFVNTIKETRRGYYSWKSPPLVDGDTVQYRVSAIDLFGNAGTPIAFSILVCCHPKAPSVSVTINSGNIVVSEA